MTNLNTLLKNYYVNGIERSQKIKDIVTSYEGRSSLHYQINEHTSLILDKNERRINRLRKYRDSPFPYLSNIELFSITVGDYDTSLEEYGLKIRSKRVSLTEDPGTIIYVLKYHTINGRGNQFLKRQYKKLESYRNTHQIKKYWSLSWKLIKLSRSFLVASLNSWQPIWYKTIGLKELICLIEHLNKIVTFQEIKSPIYNTWIESPLGKWRQLGVPCKAWRLYLHMLNMFLSYIYSPHLDPQIYDGFIFNRGCKTWWETVLWGNLLTQYHSIMEVDLSSGFPNLSLHSVRSALLSDGLIPTNLVELIIHHLKSPLIEAVRFPTLETYIENKKNKSWRNSDRSVHMGLGISPILFVLTVHWILKDIKILQPSLSFSSKWYADDASFYFNLRWILTFLQNYSWISMLKSILKGENPLITQLNQIPSMQQAGIRFCTKKSGFVRILGLWLKNYKSLGLSLESTQTLPQQIWSLTLGRSIPMTLRGSTRGRGYNPITKRPSTLPSSLELDFGLPGSMNRLNLSLLLKNYKPYFGLLMSRLYSGLQPTLKKKLPFEKSFKPNSLLGKLNPQQINKILPPNERLDLYNSGSNMSKLLLNLLQNEANSLVASNSRLKKQLKITWKNDYSDVLKEEWTNILKQNKSNKLDLFQKYSELNLSSKELAELTQEYKQTLLKQQLNSNSKS